MRHHALPLVEQATRHEFRGTALPSLSDMTLHSPPTGGVNRRGSTNFDGHHVEYYNTQNWSTNQANTHNSNGGLPPKPRYPHIKDLQARADTAIRELSGFMPVCLGIPNFARYRTEFLLGRSNAPARYRFVPFWGVHNSRPLESTQMLVLNGKILRM